MAWLTHESPDTFNQNPEEPDLKTLMYWISRLEPLIRADSNEEFIIIFANRCGSENEATYSGTSAVVGIASGEVRVYGILGRGQSDLLVVDTCQPPFAKLVYRPEGDDVPTEEAVGAGDDQDVMNGASSHDDARRRGEEQQSQDASPRKHEVQQPTTTDASAFRHDESDGWSVSSERRLPAPSAADEIIIAVNSLGIDDQEAHTPHTPNHGRPPSDTRWMADDDSELAYVEGEDAQQPFHDPTGIIGQWVQMIQTPREAPARPQHHQEHVAVLANGCSHITHDDRESGDIFFSPVESDPPELAPSMSIRFLQGEHEFHGHRRSRSSLRIDSSRAERGWVAHGDRFQQDPKTPVAMVLTSR